MYDKKGYQFVLNGGDIIHTWSAGKERTRIDWEKVRRGSSDAGAGEKCEQENNWKFEIKWIWTMKCWTHPVVISNKEEEEARKKTFGILRSSESKQWRSRWVRRWSSGLKSITRRWQRSSEQWSPGWTLLSKRQRKQVKPKSMKDEVEKQKWKLLVFWDQVNLNCSDALGE